MADPLACPHCGFLVAQAPGLAGQVVECPNCRCAFHMPYSQAIPVAAITSPVVRKRRVQRSRRPSRSSRRSCGCSMLLITLCVLLGAVLLGRLGLLLNSNPRSQVLAAFNVPSLIGKTIDEVRAQLGAPDDEQPEPSELQMRMEFDQWDNVFSSSGYELLITFDPRTRQVKDFFLAGQNVEVLLERGNLVLHDSAYTIEPVKSLLDSSTITGIKIIPRK